MRAAAQRLVRRLCPSCARPWQPSAEDLAEFGSLAAGLAGQHLKQPTGCEECGNTGFRGRMGLFELLPVDEALRVAILDKRPAHELERLAARSALDSLWSA
jgi:type II secretory ATPase GspE/PulE/Tfp pilus assembly ATPase PilB-like protein